MNERNRIVPGLPPERPRIVGRPRLFARLDAALPGRLTLVSAPAGYGKTTLVGAWLRRVDRRAAWVSLEEDQTEEGFLGRLAWAADILTATRDRTIPGGAPPDAPHIPPASGAPEPTADRHRVAPDPDEMPLGTAEAGIPEDAPISIDSAPETGLARILGLFDLIDGPFVLVIDDWQYLASPRKDRMLLSLLEAFPRDGHLVLVTRQDPDLPLARMRARAQLTELRVPELKFSEPEVEEFLRSTMALELDGQRSRALGERTEGWAAGLQLAALGCLARGTDTASLDEFGAGDRYLSEFLLQEVFDCQEPRLRRFLLDTAIPERICGELCDRLCPVPGPSGAETLGRLERANLFLQALDGEGRWYRYHALFRAFLRRASREDDRNGDREVELNRAASRWFEAEGMTREAFRHAVWAGDLDGAARLVDGGGTPLYHQGELGFVLDWLDALDDGELASRPLLLVHYAMALMLSGRNAEAERRMEAAEESLRGSTAPEARSLRGRAAALRATLAVPRQEADSMLREAAAALALLAPEDAATRSIATWAQAYGLQISGDGTGAAEVYETLLENSERHSDAVMQVAAAIGLGNLREYGLDYGGAEAFYRRGILAAGNPPLPVACEAFLGLARVSYGRNELDPALRAVNRSLALAERIQGIDTESSCHELAAQICLARGDAERAIDLVDRAHAQDRRLGLVQRHGQNRALRARILFAAGDPDAGLRSAREAGTPEALARAALAAGDPESSIAEAAAWEEDAMASGRRDQSLAARILRAAALHASGRRAEAGELLLGALDALLPERQVRPFLDEPALVTLGLELSAAGRLDRGAELLVEAWKSRNSEGRDRLPPALLRDRLTRREREVLALIALGRSNEEIADQLFVALTTVKGHVQNIFAKLDAKRRTEAVSRALELGILAGKPYSKQY